ncbi:hypothetical protein IW15_22470 [Chryseobacterium soli]|uniref:Uncharacterized protein n=1 Tax=Chryseobacterium soli TaxID=445961 RepID=A0A085ZZF0_9FLAO|nr:hypothetical protein [Chryseobacterium soli]KFF09814.1 hypothetical protein IW15_22470 [Chryseobacterium soli]
MKKTMMMLLIAGAAFLNAQKIEIKDDKVLLDGKAILKSEKINVFQYSFYTLDDNEIVMFRMFDNETPQYQADDYYVINFIEQRVKVQCTDFSRVVSGLGMNSKKSMEKLMAWLFKEKVLTPEGTVNPDRVGVFYDKYDEKILERTVR